MAGFTATDDELALVLGHELAHHVLGHRGWHEAETRGRQTQTVPALAGTAGGAERQADRVGPYPPPAGFDSPSARPLAAVGASTGASAIRRGLGRGPRLRPGSGSGGNQRAGRRTSLWFHDHRGAGSAPLPPATPSGLSAAAASRYVPGFTVRRRSLVRPPCQIGDETDAVAPPQVIDRSFLTVPPVAALAPRAAASLNVSLR
jgi:hypothetical protein